MDDDDDKMPVSVRWRVDRRIPMALVGAILIQTCGAVYWAATVNGSLDAFRQRFEASDRRIEAVERQYGAISEQVSKLGVVEVKVQNVQDSVTELKNILRERVPVQAQHR